MISILYFCFVLCMSAHLNLYKTGFKISFDFVQIVFF